MADLAGDVGTWKQLALIAGLRWHMLHNGLRRKHNRLDLLGLLLVGLMGAAFVFGVGFVLFVATQDFISTGRNSLLSLFFWGIFLWWQFFPIVAAGFGISFDFRSILRFPVSLRVFYSLGMAYGLADFTGLAALCWLVAMIAGTVAADINLFLPVLLIAALFVLLNVSLERLLGSWIERLLARRRTREFFFAGFILFMVSLQFIGPLLNRYGNSVEPQTLHLLGYLRYLPGSLAGRGLSYAAAGSYRDFLLTSAGLAGYASLFCLLLWFRFAAQYRGEELSETAEPARALRNRSHPPLSADLLGFLSPQVGAVIRKELHYLLRNGFAALLLFLPPVLVFALISQSRLLHFAGSKGISPELFFPGLVAYIILILMAPAYNSFAYENAGVQTYFTAPLKFRDVLLGKNFVQASLVAIELALCIAAFCYRVGWPSPPTFAATSAAVVFTVAGQLCIANWSSLSFPRKLAFGQLHGQRQSGMAVLVAFASQILLFGISSLVFGLGRWTSDAWLPAKAFTLLAAAAVGGYISSLDALTSFAEKKKEKLIEALCR